MDAIVESEKGKGLLVTKSNSLVEASYSLSLNEQRIILACAAQLDGRKPPPKNSFVLTVEEFQRHFNTNPKSTYREMEEAANRLYERDIKKIDKKSKTRMRWVYRSDYCPGEGCIKLGFSPEITPYLTMLNKRHTSYRLSDVQGLSSVYSIRLYEMLARFRDTGWFLISLEDFKDRLQLLAKYPRFSNLKARVIQPSVNELNEKSPLEVSWEAIKKGRSVEKLKFFFEEKAQRELPL